MPKPTHPHTECACKETIWQRLQALMVERWGAENQNRLAREAGVGVATIARMKQADTSVGVDVLNRVAAALNVEAWQLICPTEIYTEMQARKRLSPLALDLAASLDSIKDADQQMRAFAIAHQVIEFGAVPGHQAVAPETSPKHEPSLSR